MAQVLNITGDVYTGGNLSAQTMTIPAGTLLDAGVNAAADIAATKLEHRHNLTYSQEAATAAADGSWALHRVYGTSGSVVSFKAGSFVANSGASVVAVDLLKNGTTSILSAAISLTSSHTALQVVSATISTATLTAGDILIVKVDGTAGGGTLANGVFADLVITEKAS